MAGPIQISILANATQANQAIQQTSSRAQRMGDAFRRAAVPATAALGAIAVGAKQAIDAASDQQEAVSKSGVVFGQQAREIEQYASRAATALGQSKTNALDAASTFGLIAQKAGLGGAASAKFATNFTTLASDLASFNNTKPEEAVEALGAAFRGEAEPIRRFGVTLDEATLKAEALSLGLLKPVRSSAKIQAVQVRITEGQKKYNDAVAKFGKGSLEALKAEANLGTAREQLQKATEGTIPPLTQQQKVLAAQSAIMKQTSKAQGDFARTSDGAANKSRVVTAQIEDLKAGLGQALLPAYQKVLQIVSKVVAFFAKNQTVAKILVGVLGALALAVLAVNAAMLVNPAVLVVAGIVALIAALVVAYKKSDDFRRIVDNVANIIQTKVFPALQRFGQYLVTVVVPAVIRVAQAVAARLRPIFEQLASTFRAQIQPTIAKVVAKFREMAPTIQRVVSFVARMYGEYLKFVAAVAGKVIPVIIKFAGFVFSKVIPAIADYIGFMVKIADKTIRFGRAVVNAGKDAVEFARKVKAKIDEVVSTVTGLPQRALEALGDAGSILYNAGQDIMQGLIDGISDKIGSLTDKLGKVTDLIPDIKGPPSRDKVLLRPAGRLIMQGLIDGFDDGTSGVVRVLTRVTGLIQTTVNRRLKTDKQRKAAASVVIKSIRDETAALNRNAKAQDRVSASLKTARIRLAELRSQANDYARNVRDSILSAGSITGLGDGTGYANSSQMIDLLRERVEKARKFGQLIKNLAKAGLNKTSLQQLLDAGVDGGFGAAQTLLAGGSDAIRQVNTLTVQLTNAGRSLGESTASTMYGAGIRAAQGLVDGLQSKAKDLDKIARRLAEKLVEAVRRALRIKSPSRVFRRIGEFTAEGLTLGLQDVDIKRAGLRMADLLTNGFGDPALGGLVTAGATAQPLRIDLRLSADQVDQLSRGRAIQADLDVYRRSGGRSIA